MPTFEEVYREFQPKIRRYLNRFVGSAESEDLTQEVFAKVSRALPRFRGDASVSTWVYRIATNAAVDRLRSPSRARRDDAALPDGMNVPAAAAPDVEQTLVRRDMNDCIRQYVDRLPPSYRSVVILSEEEGLANREIAEALGVSLDTVKIRLHRARLRLKKELGDGCSFYRDERNELACEPKAPGVSPLVLFPSTRSETR
jgi:RNA polymerase sigma-70 factor, ECF subfamily